MANNSSPVARREFLKFLAASPYVASVGGVAAFLQQDGFAQDIKQSSFAQITRDRMSVVDKPADALTVFDFEATARTKVQPGHWAYMASGTDDDATLFANRDGYRQLQLRPRRLRDATKVDMRVELFGTTYASPIFTCPTGGQALVPSRRRARRGARDANARNTDADAVDIDRHRRRGSRSRRTAARCGSSSTRRVRGTPACNMLKRFRGLRRQRDRAHRRQHHRPLQRNVFPHPAQRPETVRGLPQGRLRSRPPPPDARRHRHEGRARVRPRDGLEIRRPPARLLEGQIHHQGHRHARGREALPRATVSTASWSRTTAGARPKPGAAPSRRCPKWWRR